MAKHAMLYKNPSTPVKRPASSSTHDKPPPRKVAKAEDKPVGYKSKDVKDTTITAAGSEQYHQLSPLMTTVLDQELDNIMRRVIRAFPKTEPSNEAEKVVYNKYKGITGLALKHTIGLNVTKRLLNVGDNLLVKLRFSAPPSGLHLKYFIEKYQLTRFKCIPQHNNTFAAVLKSYGDLDKLCTTKKLKCGIISVNVRPCIPFMICPANLKTHYKTKNLRGLVQYVKLFNDETEAAKTAAHDKQEKYDNKSSEYNKNKSQDVKQSTKENNDNNVKDSSDKVATEKSKAQDTKSNIPQKSQETSKTSNTQKTDPQKEIKQSQATTKVTNTQKVSQEPNKVTKEQTAQKITKPNTQVQAKTSNQTKSQEISKTTPIKTQEGPKSTSQTKQQDQETKSQDPKTNTATKIQDKSKTNTTTSQEGTKTTAQTKPVTKATNSVTKTQEGTKISDTKTQPKITKPDDKKSVTTKKVTQMPKKGTSIKTQSKNTQDRHKKSDFDELDDQDILALLSGGIVLDECSGSDEE